MHSDLLTNLRTAYDQKVAERGRKTPAPWKLAERARFLALLQAEGKEQLLEIGVGTGHDSLYFQQQGLIVTCADLSPAMVAHCRACGLDAHTVDFAALDAHFGPQRFDAVYALNCLLHVPKSDLPAILHTIQRVLRTDGLFYWGQYGGVDVEGVWEGDHYLPKRFFARYTDEAFLARAQANFQLEAFCRVPQQEGDGHFHSATLRKLA